MYTKQDLLRDYRRVNTILEARHNRLCKRYLEQLGKMSLTNNKNCGRIK